MRFDSFLQQFKRVLYLAALGLLFAREGVAIEEERREQIEMLSLDVISYDDFVQGEPHAMHLLDRALHEKGIVGIRGIPGYKEKVLQFIESAREFSALPEEIKEKNAPDRARGDLFLGYEMGKEKFKRPDGKWVVDDLKVSYYAFVPESPSNKWPAEMDLKTPFQDLGVLLSEVGKAIMQKIGLIGTNTGISLDGTPQVGRLLYYRKAENSAAENPFWCGAHFDNCLFTALIPAFYFTNGEPVPEPIEAGLFVKTTAEGVFRKVVADDPEILMFQVGEFGQLAKDDAIRATEHRVHKASGCVERYAMALFFNAPLDAVVHSFSELTQDARYGGAAGTPCTFRQWHEASFNRYLVKEGEEP